MSSNLIPCDSERGRELGRRSGLARKGKSPELTELRILQRDAFRMAHDKTVKPAERTKAMRAWVDFSTRRAALEMRPAPKPVDVSKPANAKPTQVSADPSE